MKKILLLLMVFAIGLLFQSPSKDNKGFENSEQLGVCIQVADDDEAFNVVDDTNRTGMFLSETNTFEEEFQNKELTY